MPKIRSSNTSVVYSTDPDYKPENAETAVSVDPGSQDLRLHLDRRGGGKVVTIIRGFKGTADGLESLARSLKKLLGTGGSVKNGEILLQGAVRDQVLNYLLKHQFRAKKAGG